MSRFHSYLSSAVKIIETYSAGKPLNFHTKTFFAADKKFGSRDRRTITSLCYYYFRTGHAFTNISKEEKIVNSVFLCEDKPNALLEFFRPDLNTQISVALPSKLDLLGITAKDIFSLADELSEEINPGGFSMSFLHQPNLYLRARPRKSALVSEKLTAASLSFATMSEHCFMLPHGSPVDQVIKLNKEAVVQDVNSQQVLTLLDSMPELIEGASRVSVWDCCAASGGKSILCFDKLKGNVKLTVSDIREQILVNLQQRLLDAGINIERRFVADLTSTISATKELFDIIICDAPCSGSGTWSRTPEQLLSFDPLRIQAYANTQKRIALNTIRQLKSGGIFFYITCSVFEKENEGVVHFIEQQKLTSSEGKKISLQQMRYLKGYEMAADTLFVAVFNAG